MRPKVIRHRSLDDLYSERNSVTSYWKIIAQLSSWMLLGGFLILPTTFDKDPQLRMTSGVITIVLVTLLTGGYSLTALLWFACPSIIFRQEYIFIPSAAASAFGFLAASWALSTSMRFDSTHPACPITFVLTIVSAATYGALAIYTRRCVQRITREEPNTQNQGYWPQHDSGYYSPSPYSASLYPPTMHSENASVNYNAGLQPQAPIQQQQQQQQQHAIMTEDEMVNRQMAQLLTNTDLGPSPDTAKATFRLEWPGGDLEEDTYAGGAGRNRSRTLSDSGRLLLVPGDSSKKHGRHRSESMGNVGGALSKIGQAIGFSGRGRQMKREEEAKAERARSREERRIEIEMGHMYS